MNLEQINGFKPVGQNIPNEQRKYSKPNSDLEVLFEQWLDKPPLDKYAVRSTAESLRRLKKFPVEEAHALLAKYQGNSVAETFRGIFISAVYQMCDEHAIFFDVPLQKPVNCLAVRLPKDKIFVNLTAVGKDTALFSQGVVINLGKANTFLGSQSEGIIINYGVVGDFFGEHLRENSILINCLETGIYAEHNANGTNAILQPKNFSYIHKDFCTKRYLSAQMKRTVPGLQKYLVNLKQKTKARNLEGVTRENIEDNLKRMIKGAGYQW